MRKKLIVTILSVIGISTSVLAAGIISESINVSKETESFVSEEAIEQKVNNNLTQKKLYKNPEEFESIVNCCDRAKYENVVAYINFMAKNDFTDEEIKIINSVLENGTTVQSLEQVYNFWLSTDEDFSIIEKICSMEDDYFSEFWYEDAFNHITDDKHGVLTQADIRAYEEKEISVEQILAANTLSRKNECNIFEILDKVADGESIEKQTQKIYDLNVDFNKECSDFENVKKIIKAKKYNIPERLKGSIFTNLDDVIAQTENTYDNIIGEKLAMELKRLNISEPKYSSANDDTIISECGYSISIIHALENKGFIPEEIAKSAEEKSDNIFEAAKKTREEMTNEN